MEHTFEPIDSEGERERWYQCRCGVKLPESELRLLADKPELIGLCELTEPESESV